MAAVIAATNFNIRSKLDITGYQISYIFWECTQVAVPRSSWMRLESWNLTSEGAGRGERETTTGKYQ